jgi:hypothetical protein
MLRNPALAVVLFLSASCELAGAPPAQTAKPPTETPIATPTQAPMADPSTPTPGVTARTSPVAEPEEELFEERFASRAGPRWTKEKKARFKAKPATDAPATEPPAKAAP